MIVWQILLATALIAAMILIRVFANRSALRQKLNCGHADGNCGETDCPEQGEVKRSACHAP